MRDKSEWLLVVLLLASLGGFSACAHTGTTPTTGSNVSTNQEDASLHDQSARQMAATSENGQGQGLGPNQTNTVRQTQAAHGGPDTAQSASGNQLGSSWNDVQTNQPLNYYFQQIDRAGYRVKDIDERNNRIIVHLTKEPTDKTVHPGGAPKATAGIPGCGQACWLVMDQDKASNQVRGVSIAPTLNASQMKNKQDPDYATMSTNLKQMPVGRRPEEYVPMLGRYGRVTQYEQDPQTGIAHIELVGARNKIYDVQLKLDKSGQKVTGLELNKIAWT